MSIDPDAKSTEPPVAAKIVVGPPFARGDGGSESLDARRRRRRHSRRHWLTATVVVAVAAAAVAAWRIWGDSDATRETYVTVAVERGDVEDSTTALGTLQPLDFVDVGTQVSGQLRKVLVELGASVKEGDLLAEIDPTLYRARVEASRAQLLNLKAQLADRQSQLVLAEHQFQRQGNLLKANATSQEAYQSAEAVLHSATAQVEAVKAQIQNTESTLKADEANLSYTKIYAPMSGTVVSQTAKQGQTLNANQQAPIILRIADLSTMTVTTQVSEADVGRLRLGMDAYFMTLGRPDRRWHGKLRTILPTPEVVNNVVLYDALFDVPNPTGELMTQMTAQVFFVSAAAKDVLVVPVAALKPLGESPSESAGRPRRVRDGQVRSPGASYIVEVLRQDGSIEERRIRVGVINRVAAEVTDGLDEGMRVIVGTQPGKTPAKAPSFQRPARLS